jgi:hypothetical protein
MLVKIKKTSPGCTFEAGQLVKMSDKKARHLIDLGIAVAAGPVDEARTSARRGIPRISNPLPRSGMNPPRYICGCGYVAKDIAGLEAHRAECD